MISTMIEQKYNTEDALVVFSSYAKEADSAKDMNALAWYTKHLILSFPRTRKVIFLAEKTAHSTPLPFEEDGRILVIPTWQKNKVWSMLSVVRALATFRLPKRILIQFEFNIFGNTLGPVIMLLLTMIMALRRKQVYFQIHQIVLDIAELKDQINVKNPFLITFFNLSLWFFYRLIFLFSTKVIVTEEALASRLRSVGLGDKLYILPHHVLDAQAPTTKTTHHKVQTLLFFGYLSWYKGIDWLLEAFKKMHADNPQLRLVVVGGKSPTLQHKNHYNKYYANLVRTMKHTPGVTHTGFVTDEEARKWFAKADVLVMPYRAFMSSSGPLSWALAHHKPVVLSSALKDYMQSDDFASTMRQTHVDSNELFFDLDVASLSTVINHLPVQKLTAFSALMAHKRSQKSIASALHTLLYAPTPLHATCDTSHSLRSRVPVAYA